MGLLVLGHLKGDFYVQTDNIAEKKKVSVRFMMLHCIVYTAIMYVALSIFMQSWTGSLCPATIIGVLHLCVDNLKISLDKKFPSHKHVIYLLDQILHIVVLVLIFMWIKGQNRYDDLLKGYVFHNLSINKLFFIVDAVLICYKPTAIFVSLVFEAIPKTIQCAEEAEGKIDNKCIESGQVEVVKIGSWIGILEREIILLLGLLGQYGAIGFVLTAKSIARYKQLEKKAFAEKYLVGTLLSALIAIACVLICSAVN